MPEPITLVMFLAAAFVVVVIYMGYRVSVESGKQAKRALATERDLRTLAATNGWSYRKGTNRLSTLAWRIEGKTAADRAFSLESHYSSAPAADSSGDPTSRMVWNCADLPGRSSAAFTLTSTRTVEVARGKLASAFLAGTARVLGKASEAFGGSVEKSAQAIGFTQLISKAPLIPLEALGERWRIAAHDEALVRHIFDPELCAELAGLPRIKLSNVDTDDALWLIYDSRGVSFELGFIEFIDGLEDTMPQSALARAALSIGGKVAERLAADR